MNLRPLWSRHTEAQLSGIAYAQEAGLLLAWDVSQRLYLWDRQGKLKAQQSLFFPPIAGTISADGHRCAVAGAEGQLWWLDGELRLKFDQSLQLQPIAIALEPLGQYLALSDRRRRTHLFTRLGNFYQSFDTPRPLHFLEFIPAHALLLGAADYGFLGCFDPQGQCVWRDAPLANVGCLSSDGQGEHIQLACFSQGLRQYHRTRGFGQGIATAEPCHWIRTDYHGQLLLTASDPATGPPTLSLLKPTGEVSDSLALSCAVRGLVCSALGDLAICGLVDGTVSALAIRA